MDSIGVDGAEVSGKDGFTFISGGAVPVDADETENARLIG